VELFVNNERGEKIEFLSIFSLYPTFRPEERLTTCAVCIARWAAARPPFLFLPCAQSFDSKKV